MYDKNFCFVSIDLESKRQTVWFDSEVYYRANVATAVIEETEDKLAKSILVHGYVMNAHAASNCVHSFLSGAQCRDIRRFGRHGGSMRQASR